MKLFGHVHKSEVRIAAQSQQPYVSWEVVDEDTHERMFITLFEGNLPADDPCLDSILGARVCLTVRPAAPYTNKEGKSFSQVAVVAYTQPEILSYRSTPMSLSGNRAISAVS